MKIPKTIKIGNLTYKVGSLKGKDKVTFFGRSSIAEQWINLRPGLLRELREETGLKAFKITKFNFSGKYDYEKILSDRQKFRGQTFSLYSAEVKKSKVKIDNYEHSDYKWVSFSQALKMLKHKDQKKSLKIVDEFLRE